ncbi:MAG: MFS transporter, partial [Candidatus Binatia bacterium]
ARISGPGRAAPERFDGRAGLLEVLRRPVATHYAVVIVLAGLVFGTVFSFQPAFALELGRARVRGFFVAFAAAAIVVRVFFGHVPDRFGRHRVATLSLALYALGTLALTVVHPLLLEPLGAVFGFAHGLFYPAMNAMAVTAVRRHERGRIMAIFTGAFSLGIGVTTVLGFAVERLGYPPVFLLVAATTAAAVAILAGSAELRAVGARDDSIDGFVPAAEP